MTRIRTVAWIALGGNLPFGAVQPAQTLCSAIENMVAEGFRVCAVSRFFSTPCFPHGTGPDYVNAVVCIQSEHSAPAILASLHRIEHRFGRLRNKRWGRRTLDLDLLAVGQDILPDRPTFQAWVDLEASQQAQAAPDQLVLPHPRMQDRAFVLVPMADIAPDWLHPVLGQSVAAMCGQLPRAEIAAINPI